MHRSRLSVLVILAATAAACSKNDATEGTDVLAQDRALVARLEVDQETRQQPLPAACGTVTLAAQPTLANQQQARELTRQARDAEMQGDVKEARSLLHRASELDGTNKATAYQLGRTNEALGDRSAAVTAYCHYLALTPTTREAVEAHQRLSKLSQQPVTRVAGGTVVDSTPAISRARVAPAASATRAPARRVTRERPRAEPRVVASAPVERPATAEARAPETSPSSVATGGAEVAPTSGEPVITSREVDGTAGSTAAGGDMVATTAAEPAVTPPAAEEPSTAPRTTRRAPNRAQSAGIGAGMGAIIGAATGRSVKSAVIGAAAGGILGTMMGSGTGPLGRITPYASGRQ